MSTTTTRRRRFRRINAQSPSAAWRAEPATELQWAVLRRIGRESGASFSESITRGEASAVIGARFAERPDAARRSRRARRRRARQVGPCS